MGKWADENGFVDESLFFMKRLVPTICMISMETNLPANLEAASAEKSGSGIVVKHKHEGGSSDLGRLLRRMEQSIEKEFRHCLRGSRTSTQEERRARGFWVASSRQVFCIPSIMQSRDGTGDVMGVPLEAYIGQIPQELREWIGVSADDRVALVHDHAINALRDFVRENRESSRSYVKGSSDHPPGWLWMRLAEWMVSYMRTPVFEGIVDNIGPDGDVVRPYPRIQPAEAFMDAKCRLAVENAKREIKVHFASSKWISKEHIASLVAQAFGRHAFGPSKAKYAVELHEWIEKLASEMSGPSHSSSSTTSRRKERGGGGAGGAGASTTSGSGGWSGPKRRDHSKKKGTSGEKR
eukprot:TRINITY_DN1108_c2_g1_i3.p1 TRINITY_DN1108_c2_g1~~TRINITY_DN1108_c2_g1_i3.p1  ORF type:complete len:352 (-),score=98.12 TRINITY_DN1108_c2_g1_i3:857-1912(-)